MEVDGSEGEGGGQIIRNAVTYACLLQRKLSVKNIRAGRPKPGLASQHLESILAIMKLSHASSPSRLEIGSTEFELDGTTALPTRTEEGIYTTVDLKTAGSISLCIQCILPYLLTRRSPSQIKIIGGTHVMKAPNFDYLERVFVPIMNRFLGYNVKVAMDRPGYFPRGGGRVSLYVDRSSEKNNIKFNHFQMVERGRLLRVQAIVNVPEKLSNRMDEFCQLISRDTRDIEKRTVPYASVEYYATFDNSYAGFYYLAPGRNPTVQDVFNGIREVHQQFQNFMESNAVVDEWMQDQLIMYMTMAKLHTPEGSSEILCQKPTDHTISAINVSHLFVGDKFKFFVKPLEDGKTFSVSV